MEDGFSTKMSMVDAINLISYMKGYGDEKMG